ncbi:MAG TPA: discoidin domain-containing protein [Rhodanobacteraceae bacterium]|nr:discoidin domain-containing protein [Rhodanobacteraceae bacterium]
MTILFFLLLPGSLTGHAFAASRVLDNFDDLKPWTAQHTDDVTATLHSVDGKVGKALRLQFDFTDAHGNPINGYATARRALPLVLPDNYELSFWIRGQAPVNTLQFKLVDASGENVWWLNRPDFTFPRDWHQIRVKKRQIEFAWGPIKDRTLRQNAAIEFVVSSGRDGGKGSIEIDELAIRELPPEKSTYPPPLASASSSLGPPAQNALDARPNTPWCSAPGKGAEQAFDVDLREPREFGGLVLDWQDGAAPKNYDVQFSDDRRSWHTVRRVRDGDGGRDSLDLPESETRYVRVAMHAARGDRYCLLHLELKDLAWGATSNAFFRALARDAPRGTYPRGFSEQPYWTVVGIDGGPTPALISEDGALQPGKAGFSIEPLLKVGGKLITWADVQPRQSLRDGYLPIPRVEWKSGQIALTIEAFASGTRERSQVVARYELRNDGDTAQAVDLALAIRPFQVNPPAQFLNTPGGVAPINDLARDGSSVLVDGEQRVLALRKPDRFVATTFDAGSITERLRRPEILPEAPVHDETGYASGALVYQFELPAHGTGEIALVAPLTGTAQLPDPAQSPSAWVERQLQATAAGWHERLDRVRLKLPASAQRIADTVRTALAHILITRDGAALRPGTRSYARSWIRDGAMIADGLLRLGDGDAVRDYVDWYSPHQFANGKVPCCVDHRGSDPVPENDSHGELIHLIAQLYRYGGDRAGLERSWPHIAAAIDYMDVLRRTERSDANRAPGREANFGLMPASISHEGYSAKPMHSYWDDFWALTGYKDAVDMARALGKQDAAAAISASRDEFRHDLFASLGSATKAHAIDYLPGCAELGDFDATSATIMLSPAGEQQALPQDPLHNTFERYWRGFVERSDDVKPWEDYTPYEWRTVGSFVRLGWRERAQAAIDFFFASGARPLAWNQWAEVVGHDARKPRFVGDMPHGWVASDFVRSALDLFAYEREADHSLVLAAGVPEQWLDGDGVSIEHLRTPYGDLSYSLRRDGKSLTLHVAGRAEPPGGFVLAAPGAPAARVRVNGTRLSSNSAEVRFERLPATVLLEQ